MGSEQIVDDSIWDSVRAKKCAFNDFLIEHQGDGIVFLCGERQIGTLKSIIFESINSAEALSFEIVMSDNGYEHTDPFAQPYIKITLDGVNYYISYEDSEFILEAPQFWRLTPVGKFKNSERQLCLTYSITQYVPIIMNLVSNSDSESDNGAVASEPTVTAEPTVAAEPVVAESHQTNSDTLNQTRRLRIVKDFLRRTLKIKRS